MKTLRSAFQFAVARTGADILPKFAAAACLLLLLLVGGPAQGATNAIKWDQPPVPVEPTNVFWGWNQQSVHSVPYPAADDWVCTTTNPITKIRWWGSFTNYQGTNLPSWILPSSFLFVIIRGALSAGTTIHGRAHMNHASSLSRTCRPLTGFIKPTGLRAQTFIGSASKPVILVRRTRTITGVGKPYRTISIRPRQTRR
jgi:hypothetical protein